MTRSLIFWAVLVVIGVAVWVLSTRLQAPLEVAPDAAGAPFPGGELVDLSHTYDQQTLYWPTAENFRLQKDAEGVTPAGYYYASNSFFTSEHGGTHLDAPVHFAEGRQSVDQIPLQRFFGPVVVVDVTQNSQKNADYQVTVDDLIKAESEGAFTTESIVLLRTGFSRRWPDAARNAERTPWRNCISRGSIRTLRSGWWRRAFARSVSILRASTTVSPSCSKHTARCTRRIFLRSRT